MRRNPIHALTLILVAALIGCSSGPEVSGGLPLLNRRLVSVGDVVTVELPMDPQTGEGWRLEGFDSAHLHPLGIEPKVRNGRQIGTVFRFEAQIPGDTRLDFIRVRPGGVDRSETESVVVVISGL